MSPYSLVADIGGTNARFALFDRHADEITQLQVYPTGQRSFEDTLCEYWESLGERSAHISQACFALATAITTDPVQLTNAHWQIPLARSKARYGLSEVKAINDFSALSLAVPRLGECDLSRVGGGRAQADKNRLIVGPGTGLGMGALLYAAGRWLPIEGEGGHITLGATNERELALFEQMAAPYGAMDAELVVSGMGLPKLYQALCQLDGVTCQSLEGPDIFSRALAGQCPICEEVLSLFCLWLGDIAGNAALTVGAWGGVYIGGGIVPKLGEYFHRSGFRQRFEAKGRYQALMQSIPVSVIHKEHIALQGAELALDPVYAQVGLSV